MYVLGKWRQHPRCTIQIQCKILLEEKTSRFGWRYCNALMPFHLFYVLFQIIYITTSSTISLLLLERILASRSLTQLLQNFSTRWFIKLSISVPGCDRNILPFFSAAVQSLASWFFPQISKNRAFNQFLLCGEISRT